jgi:hypothetical protein
MDGGTYIEPVITMRRASCSSPCDDFLGTKAHGAAVDGADHVAGTVAEADTTTTGTAG